MKKNGSNMARPRKKIDTQLVETLASYGLTIDEISEAVNCAASTLKLRFSACLRKGWSGLKTSLKREQVAKALTGNVPMLIWLGKQYLNQRDRIEQEVDWTGVGRLAVEGQVKSMELPVPRLTFSQALVMLEQLRIEMDPEKIKAAEAAELGESANDSSYLLPSCGERHK
jgi:hypothetical protein